MESIMDLYDKHITQNADPRIRDWPLMPSIVPSVVITALYLVFVLVMPRVMQNKPALNLQIPIVLYNFGMVLFSFYIFIEILMAGWLTDYSVFGCQPVDYSDSANGFRMARACWLFFISKYVELLDTIFFILRKKNSQVTFLHVFHHGALPIFWWFGVKIVPGGFGTFHTMVNAFVHTVMYFYYGVSALGPRYRKYLWWKRYITILQLTQFFIVTLHNSQLLFVRCDNYPVIFAIAIQGFTSSVAVLFLNFYIKTYITNRQHGKVEQNGLAQNGHITQNGEVHSKMKYH